VGPDCFALHCVVTDNYAGLALLQLKWVSLLQGTDTNPEMICRVTLQKEITAGKQLTDDK